MGNLFVLKPFIAQHPDGIVRKGNPNRCVLGFDLVPDQPVKVIPEFMKDIEQKNNGHNLSVLALIPIDICPSFFFQPLDPAVHLFDAFINAFPPGGGWEKAGDLLIQFFSQAAERVGKGGIMDGAEKVAFFRVKADSFQGVLLSVTINRCANMYIECSQNASAFGGVFVPSE
jgi:hypothetical protein